jgi:hypothetical protein
MADRPLGMRPQKAKFGASGWLLAVLLVSLTHDLGRMRAGAAVEMSGARRVPVAESIQDVFN